MNTNTHLSTRNHSLGGIEILLRTEGVEVTEALQRAVMTKIGRVRQYAPGAIRARVQLQRVLSRQMAQQYRAHVLYEVPGNDISAQHIAHEPQAAVDLVSEKIERRLRKRKTALLSRRTRRWLPNRQDNL